MGETRETMTLKRRSANEKKHAFKTAVSEYVGDKYENAASDCIGRIQFLLSLYRFICSVFYTLFRSVLWEHLILKKLKQYRSSPHNRTNCYKRVHVDSSAQLEPPVEVDESSDELCFDDSWILVNDLENSYNVSGMESYKMIHEQSWIIIEKQVEKNYTDASSLGDTVDENINFVTYLEDEDGDGFQDDDYNDILRQYNWMDPLERVLDRYEIDWDGPICPLHNLLDEEQVSEASDCSEQGEFIDDHVTAAEVEYFRDDHFWIEDMQSDRLCLSNDYISDRDFWAPPLEGILENEAYVLPIYDEDVLTAIAGIQRKKQNMPELVAKFNTQ